MDSDLTPQCDPRCWQEAICRRCGRSKAPRGRSLPLVMCGSRCHDECPGYAEDPKPPHLWPNEAPGCAEVP